MFETAALLAILPYVGVIGSVLLAIFGFAILVQLLNVVGFNLLEFLAVPLFQVIALVIAAYAFWLIFKAFGEMLTNATLSINPMILAVLLAGGISLFHFGLYGTFFATVGGGIEVPTPPAIDLFSIIVGVVVGGAAVYFIDTIGKTIKTWLFKRGLRLGK